MERIVAGQRFGRLITVKKIGQKEKWGPFFWNCLCDCGKAIETTEHKLCGKSVKNPTRSCGCYRKEKLNLGLKYRHGDSSRKKNRTRLYGCWISMIQRCRNPKGRSIAVYSGIRVCDEWLKYENFKLWAIENNYQDNLVLHRKNPNKDYHPQNCIWIEPSKHCQFSRLKRNPLNGQFISAI